MRLGACDYYTPSTLIGGKGGASPSSLHTTHEGPTEHVNCKMDVIKVYTGSYMASNGSCLMVTWILSKNRLSEVSQTQNWEIMTLPMLTYVDLFYFIMCENSHE